MEHAFHPIQRFAAVSCVERNLRERGIGFDLQMRAAVCDISITGRKQRCPCLFEVAAATLRDAKLEKRDRFSLVMFANQAEVVVPSSPAGELNRFETEDQAEPAGGKAG